MTEKERFPRLYRRSPDQDASRPARHRVVVVGGGPVGLALAADLGSRGIACVVADGKSEFGEGSRFARIDGQGGMRARMQRARALRALLDRSGWDEAERVLMQGDASSRAYERLVKPDGTRAVLMISPARHDGPPVRNGKPYSAIVKLAESVHAFVGVDRGLVLERAIRVDGGGDGDGRVGAGRECGDRARQRRATRAADVGDGQVGVDIRDLDVRGR